MSKYIIPQKGETLSSVSYLRGVFGALSTYICVVPLFLLDLFIWQFQIIYFGMMGIPRVKREEYVVIDRHRLSKLTIMQKFNCAYCDYANGFMAYGKAVANQMEVYSCAIKNEVPVSGKEHHKNFFSRKKFN